MYHEDQLRAVQKVKKRPRIEVQPLYYRNLSDGPTLSQTHRAIFLWIQQAHLGDPVTPLPTGRYVHILHMQVLLLEVLFLV